MSADADVQSAAAVEIHGLTRVFKTVTAVDNIDLIVEPDEISCPIG